MSFIGSKITIIPNFVCHSIRPMSAISRKHGCRKFKRTINCTLAINICCHKQLIHSSCIKFRLYGFISRFNIIYSCFKSLSNLTIYSFIHAFQHKTVIIVHGHTAIKQLFPLNTRSASESSCRNFK